MNLVHETAKPSGTWAAISLPGDEVTSVDVRSLPPGSALTVDTMNSRYHIVVLDGAPGLATMQGGGLLPEPTDVRIEGSTAGGSGLRKGWICVGLHLECVARSQRLVTSQVRSITIEA